MHGGLHTAGRPPLGINAGRFAQRHAARKFFGTTGQRERKTEKPSALSQQGVEARA